MKELNLNQLEETLKEVAMERDAAWTAGERGKYNKLTKEYNEVSGQMKHVEFGEAGRFISLIPTASWGQWKESNIRTREHIDRIALELNPKLLPKYGKHDTPTFRELVAAGVKPETLFPNVSIKEAREMVESNPYLGMELSELRVLKITYKDDITVVATDLLTYRWAVENLEYLKVLEMEVIENNIPYVLFGMDVVFAMRSLYLHNGRFTAPQSAILELAKAHGWEIKQLRVNSECGN